MPYQKATYKNDHSDSKSYLSYLKILSLGHKIILSNFNVITFYQSFYEQNHANQIRFLKRAIILNPLNKRLYSTIFYSNLEDNSNLLELLKEKKSYLKENWQTSLFFALHLNNLGNRTEALNIFDQMTRSQNIPDYVFSVEKSIKNHSKPKNIKIKLMVLNYFKETDLKKRSVLLNLLLTQFDTKEQIEIKEKLTHPVMAHNPNLLFQYLSKHFINE